MDTTVDLQKVADYKGAIPQEDLMKKLTILAILVIAGAIAGAVACGGDTAKPADNPGTTTTTSSGAPSDSAAPAASK